MKPEVAVTTLSGIRLLACVELSRTQGRVLVFRDEQGRTAATCPAAVVGAGPRTLPLRPDEPAWDLGPVDIAILAHLVQTSGRHVA